MLDPLNRMQQEIARNIDRQIQQRIIQRTKQNFRLDAGARTILDDRRVASAKPRDVASVFSQNAGFGSRRVILGNRRDLLEKFRPTIIVQPTTGKCLLELR